MSPIHGYLLTKLDPLKTKFHPEVCALLVQSLEGKRRIFVPGRRTLSHQVAQYSAFQVAYSLKALMAVGKVFDPRQVVGIPILTEGLAVPFAEAFRLVWGDNVVTGGIYPVFSKRKPKHGELLPGEHHIPYAARMGTFETEVLDHLLPESIAVFFDIGATGATMEAVVPLIVSLSSGRIKKMVFASPCASPVACQAFLNAGFRAGLGPESLNIVVHEGLFGLGPDGTALSLQLPQAITSGGNLRLSRLLYKHPGFCHIGSGGLAATSAPAYLRELQVDQERFQIEVPGYESLESLMGEAGLRWPDDFQLR